MDGIIYLHNVIADTEKQGMLWAYENAVNTLMWRWNEPIWHDMTLSSNLPGETEKNKRDMIRTTA